MSSVIRSLASLLEITESQMNLVIISMCSALFQLVVYIHLLRKTNWSLTILLYVFIVFVSNILFFKIFMSSSD
jgi:ATP/ADP translocase